MLDELLNSKGKVIAFDIDLTLTKRVITEFEYYNSNKDEYLAILSSAIPNYDAINLVNKLSKHNDLLLFTSRPLYTKKVTKNWLASFNDNS